MNELDRIYYTRMAIKLTIALAIVVLLLWWKGCSCNGGGGTTRDTISVRVDTFWKQRKDSLVYVPVPYKVTYPGKKIVLHDTLEEYNDLPIDSSAAVRLREKYFATRYYDTMINVQYGSIWLKDTVTQNRITGRFVELNQQIPEITKTITLQRERRVTLYLSLQAMGNDQTHLFGTGAGIGIMDKRGRYYGANYLVTKDYKNMILAEIKIPIRLHKN